MEKKGKKKKLWVMDEVGFSYYKILHGNLFSDLLLDNVVCFVTFICAICLPGPYICLGFPIIAREKANVFSQRCHLLLFYGTHGVCFQLNNRLV